MTTDRQILTFRAESAAAGDLEAVRIADRAMQGSARARRIVARMIREGQG